MDEQEILEWFGDYHKGSHYNIVKCNTVTEAEDVINVLKSCGLKQGEWSPEEGWLDIMVYDDEIHAFFKRVSMWEHGVPVGEFIAMVTSPTIVDDLI